MDTSDIKQLIDAFKKKGVIEPSNMPVSFSLKCTVLPPTHWNKAALEERFSIKLPVDIVRFWNESSGVRLFEDISYGQWGLIIWSPDRVIEGQGIQEIRSKDFCPGDLVIGEFLGDLELPILRCDPMEDDFG